MIDKVFVILKKKYYYILSCCFNANGQREAEVVEIDEWFCYDLDK